MSKSKQEYKDEFYNKFGRWPVDEKELAHFIFWGE